MTSDLVTSMIIGYTSSAAALPAGCMMPSKEALYQAPEGQELFQSWQGESRAAIWLLNSVNMPLIRRVSDVALTSKIVLDWPDV